MSPKSDFLKQLREEIEGAEMVKLQRVSETASTETQRIREIDEIKDMQDIPPLFEKVETLLKAVEISLQDGIHPQCLFTFARALKAFECTAKIKLPPQELDAAFNLWWTTAKPILPTDADYDEYRFEFSSSFGKTRAPLGANPFEEALRCARSAAPPAAALRYASPKIRQLVGVCYHLQRLAGSSPFFLSVRDAAKILETRQLTTASTMLAGLVRDKVLIEVERGVPGGKRATRFRFNAPEFSCPLATPRLDDQPVAQTPATANPALPVSAGSTSPKPKPSTYDLAEAKKALLALLKDYEASKERGPLTPEQRAEGKEIKAKLKHVNKQLAGLSP